MKGTGITEIIFRIHRNDQDALEKLMDSLGSWLFSVSLLIVQDKNVAEEIVQDAFVNVWKIRGRIKEIENIQSYLYAAVRNASYRSNNTKSKHRFIDIDEVTGTEYIISPEDVFIFEELRSHLNQAIEQLPEKCREIFKLVRIEGYSYKKTAETLNISSKTVDNQLNIAQKKMSAKVEAYLNTKSDKDTNRVNMIVNLFLLSILY